VKPHIYKVRGWWACSSRRLTFWNWVYDEGPVGLGTTPDAAYDNWYWNFE
jgi:hypothetical protein